MEVFDTTLSIFGFGYVGKAICTSFQPYYDIKIIDPAKNNNNYTESDGVIIAVSTPQQPDGRCDMQNIYDTLDLVDKNTPVLIKSTISLEGWQKIRDTYPYHRITYSPEFLRAATANKDFATQKYAIFATDKQDFWKKIFQKVFPDLNTYDCTMTEAIAIKYAENSFLALKVSFFNQLYDYCNASHADFDIVRKLLCVDSRIGDDHSYVTEERGWGGHCFPKDTSAWTKTADDIGVDLTLVKSAINYNKKIRKVID